MSRGLDNFHSSYVYRVLRPNEDPNSDLTCSAPRSSRTISQHVATGLKDPSRYISTTSSMEKALKWIDTANEKSSWRHGNKRDTIVKIDVGYIKRICPEIANSAYDLTDQLNRDTFLKTAKERNFSYAYSEVVFMDRIPNEAVSIEYKHGIGFVNGNKTVTSIQRHKQVASKVYSSFDNLDYTPDNVPTTNLATTEATGVPSNLPNTNVQRAINVPHTIQAAAKPSVISPSFECNLSTEETVKYFEPSFTSRYNKPSESYNDGKISKIYTQISYPNNPATIAERNPTEIDQRETIQPCSYPNYDIMNKECNIPSSSSRVPHKPKSRLKSLFCCC